MLDCEPCTVALKVQALMFPFELNKSIIVLTLRTKKQTKSMQFF